MITLIDFYADWCGPCQAMKPIFKELEKELQGKVEFKTIDVEADQQLSSQYGIMSIPTFVILKDGKEIDRKMGAMPKQVFLSWLTPHLA